LIYAFQSRQTASKFVNLKSILSQI